MYIYVYTHVWWHVSVLPLAIIHLDPAPQVFAVLILFWPNTGDHALEKTVLHNPKRERIDNSILDEMDIWWSLLLIFHDILTPLFTDFLAAISAPSRSRCGSNMKSNRSVNCKHLHMIAVCNLQIHPHNGWAWIMVDRGCTDNHQPTVDSFYWLPKSMGFDNPTQLVELILNMDPLLKGRLASSVSHWWSKSGFQQSANFRNYQIHELFGITVGISSCHVRYQLVIPCTDPAQVSMFSTKTRWSTREPNQIG